MRQVSLNEDFDKCDLVFVYGTLKKGYVNNKYLQFSVFVKEDTTQDLFVLGDVGFPYAFKEDQVKGIAEDYLKPVEGEVWQMDSPPTFWLLDRLEGVPTHYDRQLIKTQSDLTCWMYSPTQVNSLYSCYACKETEGGNWKWS